MAWVRIICAWYAHDQCRVSMPESQRRSSVSHLCVSCLNEVDMALLRQLTLRKQSLSASGYAHVEPLPYAAFPELLSSIGLRSRQKSRLVRLKSRKQPIHRRASIRRRLLLRNPYDSHHRTLRASQGAPTDTRTETARARREAQIRWRRRRRSAAIQGRWHQERLPRIG